jgi:hypothetical protein
MAEREDLLMDGRKSLLDAVPSCSSTAGVAKHVTIGDWVPPVF